MRRCLALGSLLLVAGVAPAEAQTYRQFSLWCYDDGAADQTIQGCDAVIRWARESPRDTGTAFYNRGLAFGAKGQLERAIDDYNNAITLRPDLADAYNNRGLAWRLKGDPARALQDFDAALYLSPGNVDALYNRGLSLSDLKQYDRALAEFGALLQRRPGDFEILEARAVVFLHLARFDAAVADYDLVLKASPNAASALFGRGLARRSAGDPARGNADIAAAKALQPGIADTFARVGLGAS